MKKNCLLMVGAMVTIYSLLSVQTATAQFYIVGSQGELDWDEYNGVEMPLISEMTYSASNVNFGSSGDTEFLLLPTSGSWTNKRTSNGSEVKVGEIYYPTTGGSNNLKVAAGVYNVTYNSSTNTLLLETIAIPEVTIPTTGRYTSGYEISIGCTYDDATIYYTTDGTDPTSSSTQYNGAFTLADGQYTVKAIAFYGDQTSSIVTSIYYFTSEELGAITINFKGTESWSSANIWAWTPDEDLFPDWPGESMCEIADCAGWFTYTFEEEVECVSIIISTNKGITQSDENLYIFKSTNFEWVSANEALIETEEIPIPNYIINESITVGLKKPEDWNTIYLYASTTTNESLLGSFPGEELKDEDGDGWYNYTFDASITEVSVIFSDNGSESYRKEIDGITESASYEFRSDTDATDGEVLTYKEIASEIIYEEDVVVEDYEIITVKASVTYKTLTISNNAEIKISTENGGSIEGIESLEIIKEFKYTGSVANEQWFSLALPYKITTDAYYGAGATGGTVERLVDGKYVAANYGEHYITFYYDEESRAENSSDGSNWKMVYYGEPMGDVVQFDEAGTHIYKFTFDSNAATTALTDGYQEDLVYYTGDNTADTGWNMLHAGKTYTTDYSADINDTGVENVQVFNGSYFELGGKDEKIAPGAIFAAKLSADQSNNYNPEATNTTDAVVEKYTFELIDAEGEMKDRIFIYDGSNKEQYRLGKMSAMSVVPQMSISVDGSSYCTYSSLASDTNKSYSVALTNLTEGCQIVMTAAETQSVTVDGVATTLDTAVDVTDGTITITIGSVVSSVGDAAVATAKVYAVGGAIVIEGAGAYAITNMSGVTVASGVAEGNTAVEVAAGIYIVKTDNTATKVIVK